jgi:hypothetical protein
MVMMVVMPVVVMMMVVMVVILGDNYRLFVAGRIGERSLVLCS